jgi:uncharacterized protein (DUF488 family)
MPETIFTIGHSNLSFVKFIALLQANNITHIIDIRSIPYSRRVPWSDKSRLSEMLRPFNIRYTYLGHKLGGKKQTIHKLSKQQGVTPKEIYEEAIQILLQLSLRDNLSLLCAEGDPANCHRQHIIAQTLLNSNAKVIHILKDGTLKAAWKEDLPPKQPALF